MSAPPPVPAPAAEDIHRFPCPACGSDLRFDARAGALTCDHCGHSDAVETGGPWAANAALRELDYASAVADGLPSAEMETTRVVHCTSCGADVEMSGASHSAECPFCATPIVGDTGAHRQIKPQALLPFGLTEAQGRDAMTKWLGRLWFAPNGLQEYARKGRRMQGIYVPYWTYDAATRSAYTGQRGDDYWTTETRMVDGKSQQVRVQKTRWTSVSGRVARDFDDVLALASTGLPRGYTDALEPWDLDALVPYRPEYLAGYRAEGYQIGVEDGFAIAREKMDGQIRQDVARDIGGDKQIVGSVQTDYRNVTFKHVLLPVWLAAYKYRGRSYRFVVNARTGEVKGERPWSAVKIAVAVVLVAIAGAALLWLGAQG